MKVSVVMATYNGAAYVQEQIDSILTNERPPDELIMVDDGSSDGTLAVLNAVAAMHPTLRVVVLRNERNIGATLTFVRAVLESTGDVVLFADQDDRWHANKIGLLVKCFTDRPGLLMAYSDGSITNAALQPDGRSIFSTRNKAHLALGAARDAQEIAANPDIKGCTMALDGAFARRLFEESDPAFARYWGHDHWAALFALGLGPVDVVREPLLLHRFHRRNSSGAVRFNPFSAAQWRQYVSRARAQEADHFVMRYRLAIAQARRFGALFAPTLLKALGELLRLSEQRRDLRNLEPLARIRAGLRIHRSGAYHRHYNGVFTLLRDLFL
ncbi:MAG: glycosyltransferase [Flavobacteriales bacterium]|nr:glycosyltransferase [Flavobacteriales bacterium]MBP6698493.1 glycosyltransferase [Flavobacteriales bacterium]